MEKIDITRVGPSWMKSSKYLCRKLVGYLEIFPPKDVIKPTGDAMRTLKSSNWYKTRDVSRVD